MTEGAYRNIRLPDGRFIRMAHVRRSFGHASPREPDAPAVALRAAPPAHPSHGQTPRTRGLVGHGKRALLLGCGSVGSHTGLLLAEMGISLTAVDRDVVERSNIEASRTAFRPSTLGMPKVMAMAQTARENGLKVEVLPLRRCLEAFSDDEIRALAYDADVIVAAFDDGPQLVRLNRIAYHRFRVVYPAFHSGARTGHVIWTRPRDVPCFCCALGIETGAEIETLHGESAFPLDIQRVSDAAARVALWLAAPARSESSDLLDPDRSIIFLDNRPSGSAHRALAVHLLQADSDPACPVCGTFTGNERG